MRAFSDARVCRRKYRYGTMRHALRDRDRMLAEQGDWTQAYHCSVCGGFHLGTPYSQQRRSRGAS